MSDPRPSITCPRCGRVSSHPEDVRQRYCGACHVWHVDVADAPAVQDAVDALVEAALPDPAAMTRAEALEEFERRYRVRVVLEVEHAGRSAWIRGATMAPALEELGDAVRPLVGHMLLRVLERLEHNDT